MKGSKFEKLQRIDVSFQCPENWDSMEGDDRQRFCAGCGCHVHNIAEMPAEEAEALAASTGKVCVRLTVNEKLGVLTKDGWIPRLALAGAIAATAAGCASSPTPVAAATTPQAPVQSQASSPATASNLDEFPDVADTHWASDPKPTTFEAIEEKIEEFIEEVKEAIIPSSKPSPKTTVFVGDMMVPTVTSSRSSSPPSK
ncbi:MAG: hypothetical protein JST51_07570 [Armatimonadetes bacterium]|nr:hypothetical protein [Armatimonadota bacterium]